MNNQSQDNPINGMCQDEISITDLMVKLWQRRGLLVVLPIIFFLLALLYLFSTAVQTSSPTVFFVQLQGIDKSSYPNGTRFSPQDLLIPEVLEQTAERLELSVDKDFREALQVEYGVPTTSGIQRKYQQKLAAKNLSATDIEKINNEHQEELRRVSERGLRITVDHSSLGLSAEQGAVLASALPRAWTEIYTQKYRVLVDTRLENVAIVNSDNPLDTSSDILFARNTLQRIERGLDVLSTDNRLKAVVSKSGYNSADLQSELQSFQELFFRPIFAGLFSNPDEAATSFLTETQLRINEIDRNIEELDRSLDDIKNFRIRATERQLEGSGRESIQFGEGTLTQMLELANQASLASFMRQVLVDRRDLAVKKSSLQTEIDRSRAKLFPKKKEEFWNRAKLAFSNLVEEYASLLSAARQSSRQAYGDFYQPLGAPDMIKSTFPTKARLVLILSLLLGFMMAFILALIWPSRN